MLKRVGSHCLNGTKAPEFIKIKFENAVAHENKEEQGSEKQQVPKSVLEVPKCGPALGVKRFFRAIISLRPYLVLQPCLAFLQRELTTAVRVVSLKCRSECDTPQLQKLIFF